MPELSAPLFRFGVSHPLPTEDAYARNVPTGLLAMTGPSATAEPGHLPVRGDLAHIRLAGRYFVPHYAVPMPHRARAGALLLAAPRDSAEVIAVLSEGEVFEVLDIAGAWAWGQQGEDGFVGYVALAAIEAIAS